MGKVLIVSDDVALSSALGTHLGHSEFEFIHAFSEQDGMSISLVSPLDLIVLDFEMDGGAGVRYLERLRQISQLVEVPVLVLSQEGNLTNISRCIKAGADDYLLKPVHPVLLGTRVLTLLDRRRKRLKETRKREREHQKLRTELHREKRRSETAEMAMIYAMCKLAESRDPETGEHLDRMRHYCIIIAQQLASDGTFGDQLTDEYIGNLFGAAPLHDIGKVAIPDAILLKPGKFTDDERSVMQTHCDLGAETLRAVHNEYPDNRFINMGIEIAQSHHEKWDGGGYPHRLRGEDIPLAARIVAVADVYDALTSARCYKDEFSHQKAIDIIYSDSGTHFDPRVVNAFFRAEPRIRAVKGSGYDLGLLV